MSNPRPKQDVMVDSEFQDIQFNQDIIELIPDYLKNVKNDFDKIQNAIENKDAVTVSKIIHRIKGSALTYGFKFIDDVSGEMQVQVKKGEFDLTQSLLEKLYKYIVSVQNQLSKKLEIK